MTYVIKLKRTTKGFENPDEAAELATSNLAYGEAAFLNKYGYIVVGRSGGTTTVGNATRVFKAIPKSMADNGLFYSEYDSDKKFVNTQIVLYNNDNYSASSYTVYPRTKFDAVTDSNNVTLTSRIDAKMNKENPTGTGTLSINRDSSGSYLTGTNSVAVGYQNVATSNSAFAEGYQTKAQGLYSHSEGYQTTAGAQSSHAEGNTTNASGQNSHAEGNATTASGLNSHAEGLGTIAQGQNQSVSGKYNVADTSNTFATIIGNGTSTSKNNAAAIDWNGNLYLKGNLYVGGSSANATGGSIAISSNMINDLYEWQQYKTSYSTSTTSTETLSVYSNKTDRMTDYSYGGITIFYGSSYTLDSQYGVYQINNATVVELTSSNHSSVLSSIPVNSYFTIHKYSRTMYQKISSTYQEERTESGGNVWVDWFNLKKLVISNFKVTTFSKVLSTNRNAYPDYGLSNSFYYIFLGKFGDRHTYTIDIQSTRTKYPGNVIKMPVLNASIMEVSQCQVLRLVSDALYIYPYTLVINQTDKISIRNQSVSSNSLSYMNIIWGSYGSCFESGTCASGTISPARAYDIISLSLQREGKIFVAY